ncbi:phosphate ABC transporter permease PstA [Methanosphaera cuniculi]|uniref:phosphate ABC transporter permease PstA n=1 Tax=Methanosphaera cuniculi TaxID=1077256 RepID=UPI0026F309A8|nr:phosphate ABC transporter permease PstA [Methanosphaera cuniculi]
MNNNVTNSDKLARYVFWSIGIITILILITIIGYIFINGIGYITLDFLLSSPKDFGASGGILPMIISTIYVTFFAILIATPIGIMVAVYLHEYTQKSRLTSAIRYALKLLASLPSIIFGLFGLVFFVEFMHLGWCVLSASLTLAIMALPTIIQTTENSLDAIPESYKEASLGLGATKLQTIIKIVIPAAIPSITTGVILAITRAIEETAAVMYTVGSSTAIPVSLFDPARPLPLHIYMLATESVSLNNTYATAVVLILLILIITFTTNYLINRQQRKLKGE